MTSQEEELQRKISFCQMSEASLAMCRSHHRYFMDRRASGMLEAAERPQLELALARKEADALDDIPPKKLVVLRHRPCLIRPLENLMSVFDARLLRLCAEIASNTFLLTQEELASPLHGSILTDTVIALQRLPKVRTMSEGELRRRIARHMANRLFERSGVILTSSAPTEG